MSGRDGVQAALGLLLVCCPSRLMCWRVASKQGGPMSLRGANALLPSQLRKVVVQHTPLLLASVSERLLWTPTTHRSAHMQTYIPIQLAITDNSYTHDIHSFDGERNLPAKHPPLRIQQTTDYFLTAHFQKVALFVPPHNQTRRHSQSSGRMLHSPCPQCSHSSAHCRFVVAPSSTSLRRLPTSLFGRRKGGRDGGRYK